MDKPLSFDCHSREGGNPGSAKRHALKEVLREPFDKLRANGTLLIPFVVSLSNHERNQPVLRGNDKP